MKNMENNKHHLEDEELQKAFAALQGEGKEVHFVSLDDEFEFNCSRCGGCCTARDDIILTPYDVYQLAVAKGVSGREVFNNYLQVHIGDHSHLPIVTIADTPQHKCPFLEFDPTEMLYKCSVNDHKPGPCKTHPFGITRTMNAKTLEPNEIRFIRTGFCNNHGDNKTTVREYLGDYLDTLDDRQVSYKLQSFVTNLLNLEKIHAIINGDDSYEGFTDEEKVRVSKITDIARTMVSNMYIIGLLNASYNFDPEKPFLEQCDQAFKNIIKISIELRGMLAVIGLDVKPKDEEAAEALMEKHISEEELKNLLKKIESDMDKAIKETEKIHKKLMEESDADTSGN